MGGAGEPSSDPPKFGCPDSETLSENFECKETKNDAKIWAKVI